MTAPRASMPQNTTADTEGRIELLETASRVHWVLECGGTACHTDTLWDRRSFGSAAALTCRKCSAAFARQQQQQAAASTTRGDGE